MPAYKSTATAPPSVSTDDLTLGRCSTRAFSFTLPRLNMVYSGAHDCTMPFWRVVTHSAAAKSVVEGLRSVWAVGAGPRQPYSGVMFTGLRITFSASKACAGEVLLDEALKMMKSSEKMSVSAWIDLMSGEFLAFCSCFLGLEKRRSVE